jgi:hypothetical protein
MSQNTTSSVVPTKYWHQLEDGRIQCDLCPRLCQLKDGQRGLCFVRARQHDAMSFCPAIVNNTPAAPTSAPNLY